MSFRLGQTITHYKLLERIGEGGMGVIFRALDTKLNRQVALKVLHSHLTTDPARRERFLREARAAGGLNHPYVATVHEVDEVDGNIFIVMEYVDGRTLRSLLKEKPITPIPAARLAGEIAEGLAHAHAAGIVHRDLKPENILIRSDNHPKILDFGVAKVLQEAAGADGGLLGDSSEDSLTREGKILGTVGYMSPEQARGEKIDARSDIFSFGIVLYEMVTGEAPFKGSTGVETLSAILKDEPRPAPELNPDVPALLQTIIAKCLRKSPADRYESAEVLTQSLRDASGVTTISGQHVGARPARKRHWALAALAILALVASGATFLWLRSSAPEAPAVAEEQAAAGTAAIPERKKIVVLPFDNLGPAEDAYFAEGMTEEITSRLAVAGGLGVISRTSAFQYDRRGKSIKDIGRDLGVDYVLEGSIRWARGPGDASRVRITPQLIRVSDDTHLWADTYDRKIDDIFQVQTEIAENVIKQLGIVLRDPERTAIGSRPTTNVASYQAYLRGIALARGPDAITEEGSTAAVTMFQRAVELDPNFALAWAELSQAQSLRYHLGYERTEAQRQRALDAVENAEKLAPGSPETHLALGYYHYWALQEYDKALEEFDLVRRERPNDVNTLAAIGFVHRRQGLWKEAVADFKKALELDPLHANLTGELGSSLVFMRDYAGAIPILDRSIAIEPDQRRAYRFKALDDLLWKGDTAAARAVFEGTFDPGDPTVSMTWYFLVLFEGRYEEARDFVTGLPVKVLQDQAAFYPVELLEAMALDQMGESARAKAAYDGARRFLLQAIEASPDDHRLHSALGIALAGLGRKEEAIREGRKAVGLYPIAQDAYAAPERVADLARIYSMTGDPSAAIDQLDLLLSVPSLYSIPWIRLDPFMKPVVESPRFAELAAKYGTGDTP